MSNQEQRKTVPIYFYYLTISKYKDVTDDSAYNISQIVDAFSKMLSYVVSKKLTARKKNNVASEKVV